MIINLILSYLYFFALLYVLYMCMYVVVCFVFLNRFVGRVKVSAFSLNFARNKFVLARKWEFITLTKVVAFVLCLILSFIICCLFVSVNTYLAKPGNFSFAWRFGGSHTLALTARRCSRNDKQWSTAVVYSGLWLFWNIFIFDFDFLFLFLYFCIFVEFYIFLFLFLHFNFVLLFSYFILFLF